MAVDNQTPNLGLPLPNPANSLAYDVLRLISALGMLDTAVQGLADSKLNTGATAYDSARLDGKLPSEWVAKGQYGVGGAVEAKGVFNLNNADLGTVISVAGNQTDAAANNWPIVPEAGNRNWVVWTSGAATRTAQVAIHSMSTAGNVRAFTRYRQDTTWSSWVEQWHTGNFDPTLKLTVGGVNASVYYENSGQDVVVRAGTTGAYRYFKLKADGSVEINGAKLDPDFDRSTSAAYGYDSSGNVETVTETVAGKTRLTTITYNAAGNVDTVVVTYDGKTRTETYTYTDGRLTGMSATGAAA